MTGLWWLLYQEQEGAWRVHSEPFPSKERAVAVGTRWKVTLGGNTRVKLVRCICIEKDEIEIL